MRLALECPISMLEMIQPFSDFDWVLAHEVSRSEVYKEFFTNSNKEKVVDNSVNEKGEPLPLDELKSIFEEVRGDFVVSPDWIGDYEKTAMVYEECVKMFGVGKVMGVLQGQTFEELFKCLEIYKGIVAVPYDICSDKRDSPLVMSLRRALVVSNIPNDKIVHLLGFTSLDEFFWYENKPNVFGIDTGVPILLGLQEKDILDPLESKEEATYNQMEKLDLTQTGWTTICRNIALLRRFMP